MPLTSFELRPVYDEVCDNGLNPAFEMKRTQLIGFLLWRGGLLIVATTALFEAARFLFRFVDLPKPLEIGFGLGAAGAVLVITSFVMERIQDYRSEGDLRE